MRTSVALTAAAAVVLAGLGGAAMMAERAKNTPPSSSAQASSGGAKDNQCTSKEHFYNPAAAKKIKESRKAEAIASGLPKRLADPLYDHLPDCIYCAGIGFDLPQLVWKVDPKKYKERYGADANPDDFYQVAWSAQTEKFLRDNMRDGYVAEFHISFGDTNCQCCTPSGQSVKPPDDGPTDTEDWDYQTGQRPGGVAWHYRTVSDLGVDPPDLTSIPAENQCVRDIKEVHPIRGPRLKEITSSCPSCSADSYNATIYAINKARATIDQLVSFQGWYAQELDCLHTMMDLLNERAQTASIKAQSAKTQEQMSAILKNMAGDRALLKQRRAEIAGMLKDLARLNHQMADCAAQKCSSSSSSSLSDFACTAKLLPPVQVCAACTAAMMAGAESARDMMCAIQYEADVIRLPTDQRIPERKRRHDLRTAAEKKWKETTAAAISCTKANCDGADLRLPR